MARARGKGVTFNPGTKLRTNVDLVWDYMRDILEGRRLLSGKDTDLIEFKIKAMAREIKIANFESSAAISALENFGYLSREGHNRVTHNKCFRIHTTDDFDPANPPQEWTIRQAARKQTEKPVITRVEPEPVPVLLPPKRQMNSSEAAVELLVTGLKGLLEQLESQKGDNSELTKLEHRFESLDADYTILRAENNDLKKQLKDLERENREFLDLADEACKGIRTAKGLAHEILSRLAILDPEVWHTLPGSASGIAEAGLQMVGWQTIRDCDFVRSKLKM